MCCVRGDQLKILSGKKTQSVPSFSSYWQVPICTYNAVTCSKNDKVKK